MGRSRLTVPTKKPTPAPSASSRPSGDTVISMIAAGVLEALKPWLSAELDRRFGELKELAADQQPAPELVTSKTVKAELGISARKLNYWKAKGLITPIKGGGVSGSNAYYLRSDVEALIKGAHSS